MGKSISRKRKRQFHGNRHTSNDNTVIECKTASSSKLEPPVQYHSSIKELSGNRIIDISILQSLFSKLACPKCLNLGFVFEEDSRYGLCSHLVLKCPNCHYSEGFSSSKKLNNASEINLRLVYGMRQMGKGHSGAKLFCATLNLPPPPVKSAFTKNKAKLLKAVSDVAQESMNCASQEVKAFSKENTKKIATCGVSVDGTWQRRGYSSLNGCVAAVSIDTGKVLDVEAMSSFCSTCKKISALKSDADQTSLSADHICRCNYKGSAQNMEAIGASRIFRRSIKQRGLIYDKYFGDGDSKGFEKVKNVYGDDPSDKDNIVVEKYECIGHVQKRVGSRLRKLKKLSKVYPAKVNSGFPRTWKVMDFISD